MSIGFSNANNQTSYSLVPPRLAHLRQRGPLSRTQTSRRDPTCLYPFDVEKEAPLDRCPSSGISLRLPDVIVREFKGPRRVAHHQGRRTCRRTSQARPGIRLGGHFL